MEEKIKKLLDLIKNDPDKESFFLKSCSYKNFASALKSKTAEEIYNDLKNQKIDEKIGIDKKRNIPKGNESCNTFFLPFILNTLFNKEPYFV